MDQLGLEDLEVDQRVDYRGGQKVGHLGGQMGERKVDHSGGHWEGWLAEMKCQGVKEVG